MSTIIAGLGNPGEEYALTRHNTGRIMLEYIAKAHSFADFQEKSGIKALISEGKIGKEKVTLVEPNNFMNKSGASIAPLVKSAKAAEKLIVIYDDLDVPFGKVKLSFNKSSGGHRGLESIIKALKTEAFIRIRVGISPATASGKIKKPMGEKDVENHILGTFKKSELETLKKISKKLIEMVELVVTEGYEKTASTMGSFSV